MSNQLASDNSSADVLVVTVSYRTAKLVCQSLVALDEERQLLANNGVRLRAVVVDNDSGDAPELEGFVQERGMSNWVDIVRADLNGGFAYGCNRGIQHGYESGTVPTHFFLLNPDAEVRPGAIGTLLEYMSSHPMVGVASGVIEEPDGTLLRRGFRFPSLLSEVDNVLHTGVVSRLLSKHVLIRPMGSKAELVDWVSGAAMLIRREVVEQLGGLDEEYFLYFEETDFCRKAHSGGWSVAFVPGSCVMHNAGASTGIMNEQARSKQLPAYWFESRRRFFAKNYGVPYACATDIALAFACLLGHVKRAALGRTGDMPAKYLGDVLRHSALWSRNRQVKPAREYQPQPRRQ